MLKTLYDSDCTTFSPQGKLFQVDYALEAVKLGSVCLGVRSEKHAVGFRSRNDRCCVPSSAARTNSAGTRRKYSRSMLKSAWP